jgi:hypothetical protein
MGAEQKPEKTRSRAWSREIADYGFGEEMAGLPYSIARLENLETGCEVHVVLRPNSGISPKIALQFVRNGKMLVDVDAHFGCNFAVFDGVLYFARNGDTEMGCQMTAFNTADGQVIWTNDKLGFPPAGHSAYSNRTYFTFSMEGEVPGEKDGDSIILRGRESQGDYITVINRRTGAILAHRIYRDNFDPIPPEHDVNSELAE